MPYNIILLYHQQIVTVEGSCKLLCVAHTHHISIHTLCYSRSTFNDNTHISHQYAYIAAGPTFRTGSHTSCRNSFDMKHAYVAPVSTHRIMPRIALTSKFLFGKKIVRAKEWNPRFLPLIGQCLAREVFRRRVRGY